MAGSRAALESYLDECEGLTPAEFFAAPPPDPRQGIRTRHRPARPALGDAAPQRLRGQ